MNVSAKMCPKCGKQADWKTYIQKHVCSYCGWASEVKSVYKCDGCQNTESFEITNAPANENLILVICKECGTVAVKHKKYLDENSSLLNASAG